MKPIIRLGLWLMAVSAAFAQRETFDVLSYTVPPGWRKQQNESGVQLSFADKKTGGYVMAAITKAMPAGVSSARENFTRQWTVLVKGAVSEVGEPRLEQPAQSNGWDIVSGTASYTDRGTRGMAALLSATGYGQTVSAVLLTNTQQFQNELTAFLGSLELAKPVGGPAAVPAPAPGTAPPGLAGLWVSYTLENNGYFSNGMPMLTAGYFRREYLLNADGTYVFRLKNWSVLQKEILFVRERGTWAVSGNQLTFTPTPSRSRSEWWAKAPSGKTNEWGPRLKPANWKMETVTYTFNLHYYSGNKETRLELSTDGRTALWKYSPRARDKSLIDNPPGTPADD